MNIIIVAAAIDIAALDIFIIITSVFTIIIVVT
jgi:hypothetical protein